MKQTVGSVSHSYCSVGNFSSFLVIKKFCFTLVMDLRKEAEAAKRSEDMSLVGLIPRLLSALFYAVSSIVIVFVNKTVLTNYKFVHINDKIFIFFLN